MVANSVKDSNLGSDNKDAVKRAGSQVQKVNSGRVKGADQTFIMRSYSGGPLSPAVLMIEVGLVSPGINSNELQTIRLLAANIDLRHVKLTASFSRVLSTYEGNSYSNSSI